MKQSTVIALAVLAGAGLLAYNVVKDSNEALSKSTERSFGERLGSAFGNLFGADSPSGVIDKIKGWFDSDDKPDKPKSNTGGTDSAESWLAGKDYTL